MRPVCRADLTTFMCRLSWDLGTSTSWNPLGLSRPVTGLLCFNTCIHTSPSEITNYNKHAIFTALIIKVVKKCRQGFKPSVTWTFVSGRVPSDVSSFKDCVHKSSESTRQAAGIFNYTPVRTPQNHYCHCIYGSSNEPDGNQNLRNTEMIRCLLTE